jgi:2-C-methyl-D-erythritol 4-phosphate cytidylyltransferase
MWLAQTPQVFARDLLLRAHDAATAPATDDAALVEALGHAVHVYEGATSNFKITTQEDLVIAEALLRERLAP